MTIHARVGRVLAVLALAAAAFAAMGSGTAYADPSPAPAASPSAPPAIPAPAPVIVDDDPAWYDVAGQMRKGIAEFISWVAETGLRPVMDTLGETVLATPDVTGHERVTAAWRTFLWIADSLLVLLVIAAGYVLVSRETFQSRYGLKQLLPRLFVAALAANFSLLLCGKLIEAANAVTLAIIGAGVDGPAAAATLEQAMFGGAAGNGAHASLLLVPLLTLAALVMAIIVVIVFFLRLAILVVLVALAPLALICHALPQTEGLAFAWWRALAAVLGIQIFQAAVLLVTVTVLLTPDGVLIGGRDDLASSLIGVCAAIAMLWILIKIPGLLKGFVLGRHRGRGVIATIATTVVAVKAIGTVAGPGRNAAPHPTRVQRRPARRSSTATAGTSQPSVRATSRNQRPTAYSGDYAPRTPAPKPVRPKKKGT